MTNQTTRSTDPAKAVEQAQAELTAAQRREALAKKKCNRLRDEFHFESEAYACRLECWESIRVTARAKINLFTLVGDHLDTLFNATPCDVSPAAA